MLGFSTFYEGVGNSSRTNAPEENSPIPNSSSNPKPNPNPNQGTVFLGGNIPGTIENVTLG